MIIGSDIQYHQSLGSTNTYALQCLKTTELQEGTVILTDFQTAGRGHLGNRWESEKGRNLLFSIILYPSSLNVDNLYFISIAISLGIYDFLSGILAGVKIKWPNDIYVKDDKIAGILIENSVMGNIIQYSIAGIGINVNQEKFSSGIPNPVSIRMLTGKEEDTGTCLRKLLKHLDIRYKQMLYGDMESIRDEYISTLYRAGEWHKYRAGGIIFTGRITGTDATGKLIIEKDDRSVCKFSFKEVDYIL